MREVQTSDQETINMSEWVPVLTRAQKEKEKAKQKLLKKGNVQLTNINKAKRAITMAERREQEDNKIIKSIEDNKNERRAKWSNISDIENKLVVLGELTKRVQNKEQKAKVKKLTDAYEKQMKNLIITKATKANNKNETFIEINSEGDNDTIMSNITCKTANSAWRKRENRINQIENNQSEQKEEIKESVTLESLGKTRRSRSMGTDKAKSENKEKSTVTKVKDNEQDDESEKGADQSIMSKITKQTTNKRNTEQEVINLTDENGK